jgi:outer membrane protein assembly factor BamA
MGGAGTVRGYSNGVFEGNHRWLQSFETRISPLPTWIFNVPYAKMVDVTFSAVLFVDGGVVWNNDADFTTGKWHGGYGFGFRLFSPFQDVVRLDFGFNRYGGKHIYFGTGTTF